jgi:hypothetical protein
MDGGEPHRWTSPSANCGPAVRAVGRPHVRSPDYSSGTGGTLPGIGLAEVAIILVIFGIFATLVVGWIAIFRKSWKRP